VNAGHGKKSLKQFAYLLAAQWLRDGVQAVFLLLLARSAVDAYGNFMLAMNMGQILLFCSEFGINQHFILLLVKRVATPSSVYRQITLLKGALLVLGSLCMAGFCLWQGYAGELTGLVLKAAGRCGPVRLWLRHRGAASRCAAAGGGAVQAG